MANPQCVYESTHATTLFIQLTYQGESLRDAICLYRIAGSLAFDPFPVQ